MSSSSLVIPRNRNWRARAWCQAAGISMSTFYALLPELKPRLRRVGLLIFIDEEPPDWLDRVHAAKPTRLTDPAYVQAKQQPPKAKSAKPRRRVAEREAAP